MPFGQESQRTADRFAHLLIFTFALQGVGEDGDGSPVVQVSQLPGGRGSHRCGTVARSAQQMRQGTRSTNAERARTARSCSREHGHGANHAHAAQFTDSCPSGDIGAGTEYVPVHSL